MHVVLQQRALDNICRKRCLALSRSSDYGGASPACFLSIIGRATCDIFPPACVHSPFLSSHMPPASAVLSLGCTHVCSHAMALRVPAAPFSVSMVPGAGTVWATLTSSRCSSRLPFAPSSRALLPRWCHYIRCAEQPARPPARPRDRATARAPNRPPARPHACASPPLCGCAMCRRTYDARAVSAAFKPSPGR